MVNPIISDGILNFLAIKVALSINKLQKPIRANAPIAKDNKNTIY